MKKLISVLLAVVFCCFSVGMRYFGRNVQPGLVYANEIDKLEKPELFSSIEEYVDYLASNYGTVVFEVNLDQDSSELYINAIIQSEEGETECSIYTNSNCHCIINLGENAQIYEFDVLDYESDKFVGEILLADYGKINVFQDEESSGEECQAIVNGPKRLFGIALSIFAIKAIKIAVLAAVAATTVYAAAKIITYVVSNLSAVTGKIGDAIPVYDKNIKYELRKIREESDAIAESNRKKNDYDKYYIAMPITANNESYYKRKFGVDAADGDLYISDYPVSYSTAINYVNI